MPASVTITWQEAATLTVTAPGQVNVGEQFAVSASVSSASLPATDVTGSTTFTVTGGAGSCTVADCAVTVPGPTTVEGSYLGRVASAPVTAIATPGIPVITSLTGGDAQVVVTFTPGLPGYPIATTYTVTATPTNSGPPVVTTDPGAGSPITVTGLVNGVSYVFQVTATNTTGSTPSAVSSALTVGVPSTITGTAPAGIVGTAYAPYTYTVGGAPAPTVTLTGGALPTGLTLTTAGVLSGTPTIAGSYTFTLTASNGVGSAHIQNTVVVSSTYTFGGFQPPVDAAPVVNTINAGQAVPIKFSLGGNYGLDILAAGSPTFVKTSCTTGEQDPVTTVAASASGLKYDPATDTYTYTWKTSKSDAKTCGTFTLTLDDGSTHQLLFKLR